MSTSNEPTRAEWLADRIASAILSGELQRGSKLAEHDLASRYDVSRTPVREALRLLAVTGLIEARPRRGAIVASLSAGQLSEMFVAMSEVEATCARLAAMRMTPIERRQLAELHRRMKEFVTKKAEGAYSEANTQFHTMIYRGAHNAILRDFAMGLRARLAPFRRAQFRTPGRLRGSYAEHAKVAAAIVRGDADVAHKAMIDHVSLVEDAFERLANTGNMPAGLKRNRATKPAIGTKLAKQSRSAPARPDKSRSASADHDLGSNK